MTKKILLLVLSLPLIIMICLFTTTNTVSLAIDVPVSGIEIISDDIVYLDLDKDETYKVEYTIYPTNASNQNVSFSYEAIGEELKAEFTFDPNTNVITPVSMGMAKVYISTADGGFKDSFIIVVESKEIHELQSVAEKNTIYVGEKTYITNVFTPSNASNQLVSYQSSDSSVLSVDKNGFVTGISKGVADIIVTSLANPEIKDTVSISVLNKDALDLSANEVKTSSNTGQINLSIETEEKYTLSTKVTDKLGNLVSDEIIKITLGEEIDSKVILTYEFNETFIGSVVVEVKFVGENGLEITEECIINKIDNIEISFIGKEVQSIDLGTTTFIPFEITPEDANVTYNISVSNNNLNAQLMNGILVIETLKAGVTTITLEASLVGVENSKQTASIDIVIKPSVLIIQEIANTYGDENIFTIGGIEKYGNEYSFHFSYGKEETAGEGFLENLSWKSSNPAVTVTDGKIKVVDTQFTGNVDLSVVYSYKEFSYETPKFTIRCVGNGINVYCYEDLLLASKTDNPIIVQKDITDFGLKRDGTPMSVEETYETMYTTYDDTYFKNTGKTSEAYVKKLISFKKDVYGNGNVVNAHNITYKLDGSDSLLSDALFKGPLNFVGITDSDLSAVSVKGQDNIIFAVYEGVTVNNLQLKGCNLKAGPEGTYDLTDLTYVGTVVEVLGDDVEFNFCRIMNGRMIMRIFGDATDPNKVINVNINNSILSGAREFIIRMGSNAFVNGTYEQTSPTIDGKNIGFPAQKQYTKYSDSEKTEYDNAYVKTFVNVKNCAFKDCGIFSIGMDSHFAGKMLANGPAFVEEEKAVLGRFASLFNCWLNLAKTSYGAKLTFEGEVRIYDWKNIDLVDSSTLIDISFPTPNEDHVFNKLKFDVSAMVKALVKKPEFKDVMYKTTDGKDFVHGGIAFFGGGLNYCCFEDRTTKQFGSLNPYTISLDDVDSSYLKWAAGSESFYFLLCDGREPKYTPEYHASTLASGNAYDFVFKK